jgi:hypothetical protein
VDPFWQMSEVERVLRTLRDLGIDQELRFKADGVTVLGIYAQNPWHIRPSFYSAAHGSREVLSTLKSESGSRGGRGGGGGGVCDASGDRGLGDGGGGTSVCRACGYLIKYDLASFAAKGWSAPKTCAKCRQIAAMARNRRDLRSLRAAR